MIRLAEVMFAAVVFAGPTGALLAREPGPVCREASVVEVITRLVRERDYYSDVRSQLVTEQPTNDPHVVRCQVCVQLAPYDTVRFGDRSIQQCQPQAFDVEIFPAGFVVHSRG